MKKEFIIGMMVLTASFVFVSCSKDDEVNETALGINDDQASEPPVVTINTVNIPNMSAPYIEEGSNGNVGNISFTGIKGTDGQYINLVGTDGGANQNIWLTIDNIQKAIKIVNAGRGNSMPAADVVFLIDDSGSMGEEADSVAKQVVAWSKVLA